jgi:hypothetical protein
MKSLFANLSLADIHDDVARNIVSLHKAQDLFDDLTDHPEEWALAQQVELRVKPPPYRSGAPIIDRPFEDAEWFSAITWPFQNWQASRFSDGSYGVWYGSDTVETTVYESAYHWYRGLLSDAGFESESVVAERKVYFVGCDAALLDFRRAATRHSALMHPSDYTFPQTVGARIHREGHPGVMIPSVRRTAGTNFAVFNPSVLSNPRLNCQLTYRMENNRIHVERQPDTVWFSLDVARFS